MSDFEPLLPQQALSEPIVCPLRRYGFPCNFSVHGFAQKINIPHDDSQLIDFGCRTSFEQFDPFITHPAMTHLG
jgi:hypothetical protein